MGRIKKYTGVFLKLGVFFAALILVPMVLKFGLKLGLIAIVIVIATIGWTAIMAIIFIPIDYYSTRRLPSEALNVRQDRELKVKGNSEQIFEECIAILKGLPFITKVTPEKEKMQLSAHTKTSFVSFRENIELEFTTLNQEVVQIHVRSRPAVRYTLLDFGKNFRNIELISKRLQDSLS